MNRDWTWLSQRETQARVAMYQQWYPQVAKILVWVLAARRAAREQAESTA